VQQQPVELSNDCFCMPAGLLVHCMLLVQWPVC
jgi:hypothetical protein